MFLLGGICPLNVFFFCKVFLLILDTLHCHVNFRTGLLISSKKPEVLTAIALSMHRFGQNWHLILSLKSHEHNIFLHLFRSFLISLSNVLWFSVQLLRVFNTADHLYVKWYLIVLLGQVPDQHWEQASFQCLLSLQVSFALGCFHIGPALYLPRISLSEWSYGLLFFIYFLFLLVDFFFFLLAFEFWNSNLDSRANTSTSFHSLSTLPSLNFCQ